MQWYRTGMRVLVLSCLVGSLAAAVAGVPEQPSAMRSTAWLTWGNDSFSIIGNGDDGRTNRVAAAYWGADLVIALDDSMLTDRDGRGRTGRRIDDVTAVLGVPFETDELLAAGGLGYRWRGDLGGEELQNAFHGVVGSFRYHLEQEDAPGVPVAWGYARWSGESTQAVVSGLVAGDGAHAVDVVGRYVWGDEDTAGILGLGFAFRDDDSSRTAQATVRMERGAFVELGVGCRRIAWSMAVSLERFAGGGQISFGW